MKKVSLLAMLLFPLSVLAADIQMPKSALSTESPNKDRVIAVAEFSDVREAVGTNARTMTIEVLTSHRPTIKSMYADGGMKLCEVKSVSNPERTSGVFCVSAQNNPSTVTIATFKHASGEPMNAREVSRNDFYGTRPLAFGVHGPTHFDCHVINGKNIGACRVAMASNER